MELTAAEGRVLGCLIEKAATTPDVYPVTLNTLRLACNQAAGRNPVVAYDDRTVEDTLLTLKSKGLARFALPTGEDRSTRYSHRADHRWRMGAPDLAVLSVLLVGGPLTTVEVEARARGLHVFDDPDEVGAVLDTLAARTPSPFAARLDGRRSGPNARWIEVLTGPPDEAVLAAAGPEAGAAASGSPGPGPPGARGGRREDASPAVVVPERLPPPSYAELAARVAELERRLAAATERPPREGGWRPGRTVPLGDPGEDRYGRRWGEGVGVGSGVPRERALPVAGGSVASAADLAERLADIERRLARIEAELGALR